MTAYRKSSLSESIYQNVKLKETDELLKIWFDKNKLEWSDEAFEIIHDILIERLGDLPLQEKLEPPSKRRKGINEKVKIPLSYILIFSPLPIFAIFLLLVSAIQPSIDGNWFSIVASSLLALSLFMPGVYFCYESWVKGNEMKRKIIINLPKTKQALGIFYPLYSLFLPAQFVPSYFLWSMRIASIWFICISIKIFLVFIGTLP